MSNVRLLIVCSTICLLLMVLVDFLIGERAEFLNAYSVMERIAGKPAAAGESLVAQRLGANGGLLLLLVLLANTVLGAILAGGARLFGVGGTDRD